jgi:molecular chaperone DnaJ
MAVQTEWLEKDYYEVLGVPKAASDKEIQRAYRRLARQYHPDANPDKAGAEERFKEISAAYDMLGDTEKRKEYDELRRLATMTGPGTGSADGFGGIRVEDLAGFADLGDLFGDLFVGRSTTGRGRRDAARGRDLEAELHLDFEEALFGLTAEARVTSGSGTRTVKVRVPPGVDDGTVILVRERGEPGGHGGLPGDLYVVVRVAPHPIFGRQGNDLTLWLPVTYPEAVLGAEVKVPTLGGRPVTVRIPPGTPSGRVLRVRGHGVARRDGGRGDLLVTVKVVVPRTMSDRERKAVEALAEAMEDRVDVREHLGV